MHILICDRSLVKIRYLKLNFPYDVIIIREILRKKNVAVPNSEVLNEPELAVWFLTASEVFLLFDFLGIIFLYQSGICGTLCLGNA